jgi:CPA2 family monovalent cation:H+ antiporter-2
VVITVNRPRTAERAVAQIRQAVPALTIIARAHDLAQKQVLGAAGASAVVPETIEASFQLAGLVMRSAGITPEQIEQTLHRERARDGAPDPTAPRRDGAAPFF